MFDFDKLGDMIEQDKREKERNKELDEVAAVQNRKATKTRTQLRIEEEQRQQKIIDSLAPEDKWRFTSRHERNGWAVQSYQKQQKRLLDGMNERGEVFCGDPIEHLEEELIDALNYLQWIKKERASVKLDTLS